VWHRIAYLGSNIEAALNDLGRPWQNRTDESFNGRLRDECLNQEWFRSRQEARRVPPAACNIHQPKGRSQITPGTNYAGQVIGPAESGMLFGIEPFETDVIVDSAGG